MKDTFGRKLYSLGEFYNVIFLCFLSFSDFKKARRDDILNKQFIERIMLAVTEVNGCDDCSFVHT